MYSKTFDTIVKKSTKIEDMLSVYYKNENQLNDEFNNVDTEENILLISEVDKKVVLPYTFDSLQKYMEENRDIYDTIQDVIEKKYTKPLNYYKHSSFARFKETFKLVKEREKGSFFQAMDLAFELFSNYNLHPAVISACKNLNELDIYLSCLEDNELDAFHYFKTIFKISPTNTKAVKA